MARPFSRSVRAPLATFTSAVSRTRPSHGIISVGAVYKATSALLSFARRGLDTSTARSRVAKRLVSSTKGASCPGDHSAYSNGTLYLPTRIGSIRPALPVQVLFAARCQSVSARSGMGSQARETPCGLEISARVVTSKVRQPGSARRRRQGRAARTAAPSSSRRFMAREANGGRVRPQGPGALARRPRPPDGGPEPGLAPTLLLRDRIDEGCSIRTAVVSRGSISLDRRDRRPHAAPRYRGRFG